MFMYPNPLLPKDLERSYEEYFVWFELVMLNVNYLCQRACCLICWVELVPL